MGIHFSLAASFCNISLRILSSLLRRGRKRNSTKPTHGKPSAASSRFWPSHTLDWRLPTPFCIPTLSHTGHHKQTSKHTHTRTRNTETQTQTQTQTQTHTVTQTQDTGTDTHTLRPESPWVHRRPRWGRRGFGERLSSTSLRSLEGSDPTGSGSLCSTQPRVRRQLKVWTMQQEEEEEEEALLKGAQIKQVT